MLPKNAHAQRLIDGCFSTSAFAYAETTDTTQTWAAGLANAAWKTAGTGVGWQTDAGLTITCNE
jgi:hypothetical protein